MKRFIVVSVLAFSGLLFSQQKELELFQEATNFYSDGRFDKAIENYEKILQSGLHSASLYYNLANAYYKTNQIASSIYYYNKALELSPKDKEINDNLIFAKAKTLDVIDPVPETFFSKALDVLTYFSFDTWAILAVLFTIIFNASLVLYYIYRRSFWKRIYFSIFLVMLLGAIICLNNAYYKRNLREKTQYAIVFSEVSNIKSEPNIANENLFQLHQGAKVQVMDSLGDWTKIKILNGNIGWLSTADIRKL